MKHEGTLQAHGKSRYVLQGFNDKPNVLTYAPTVQRAPQRLLMSITGCDRDAELFVRDVTQEYVQADDNLKRNIYITSPKFFNFSPLILFKVVRPLYGVTEAGIYWFKI